MSSPDILRRAEDAAHLLNHPALQNAFSDLESAYVEALLECKKEDDLGRFRLSEGMKVLRLVRRQLESHIEAGELAKRDAETLRRGSEGFW